MGWGVYHDVECPMCGFSWTAIRMVGTKGKVCPDCHFHDVEFEWLGDTNDPPSDGCFLDPVGWENASIITNN